MKKLLTLILLTLLLAGCEKNPHTAFTYHKVHLVSANKCVEIKLLVTSAYGTIKIQLEDDTIIAGHTSEIILIDGKCLYCEGE